MPCLYPQGQTYAEIVRNAEWEEFREQVCKEIFLETYRLLSAYYDSIA